MGKVIEIIWYLLIHFSLYHEKTGKTDSGLIPGHSWVPKSTEILEEESEWNTSHHRDVKGTLQVSFAFVEAVSSD